MSSSRHRRTASVLRWAHSASSSSSWTSAVCALSLRSCSRAWSAVDCAMARSSAPTSRPHVAAATVDFIFSSSAAFSAFICASSAVFFASQSRCATFKSSSISPTVRWRTAVRSTFCCASGSNPSSRSSSSDIALRSAYSYRGRMQRAETPPAVPDELWHVFYGLRKSIWRLWRGPLPPKETSDFRSPGADGRVRPCVRRLRRATTEIPDPKSPGLSPKSYSWPIFF
ncbi:hypothetical protein M885DRAFT_543561 [Pelagophyceae sp. CCMP2097]|nr:hypothetical protein M885DRAFT_543561 [Pelagophyceae sp. CCMP2097]